MMDRQIDLLFLNVMAVTLAEGQRPLADAFVAVRGDRIASVGPMADLPAGMSARRTVDTAGCLAMPGLVNAHVHCPMTLFRGMADDLPLMTWLNDYIFPAEAAHVDEELVYWGTRLACAEMMLSGVTGFADGYFLEEYTARAVRDAGLRGILGQGVVDFPAPGVPDPRTNVEHARAFVEKWKDEPLVRPSVFCHSAYTCGRDTLVRAKELARKAGVLFQIHVAETAEEVEKIRLEHGLLPVEYLDALGVLDGSTLAVHCVHLTEGEIDILAERGTPVAVCVESNMKLASGLADVPSMLEKGITVALGTDGPASNNDLNMFREMQSLALAYKVAGLDPTLLPAPKVLSMAAPNGAAALGWPDIGRLQSGAKADMILLKMNNPHLKPLYHPRSHLVYSATGREVDTVVVDGKIIVEDGKILTFDVHETMAKVREISRRIRRS